MIVTILDIRSEDLTNLITETLYFLLISLYFPYFPALATTFYSLFLSLTFLRSHKEVTPCSICLFLSDLFYLA